MSKKLTEVLSRKLDFVSDTPIDGFFQELDEFLKPIKHNDDIGDIYESLNLSNKELIEKLAKFLTRLCSLVAEKQQENTDIIPISLHDMKDFDTLINLLVIHGITANLPIDIGIPIAQRRLGVFKEENKLYKVPNGKTADVETLKVALLAFESIFLHTPENNYVRKILLKGGPGYSDTIIGYMALMYTTGNAAFEENLRKMETIKDTYSLFEVYSLLLSTIKNVKAKAWPLNRLSLLVIERGDGLISLIDFVIGLREDVQVDTSKFERVNQIVTSKPRSISSMEYFDKLFVQIYEGLTHIDKPILVSCLNGLVTAFYLKNKRIVKDFLFSKIYGILYNLDSKDISAKELNDMINVLISLERTPYVEVINEMILGHNNGQSFYLNLWIYSMFLKSHQKIAPDGAKDRYYNIILGLIKTYMVITEGYKYLHVILLNMVNYDHDSWEYKIDLETHLAYITVKEQRISEDLGIGKLSVEEETTKRFQELFMDIDPAVELFIELLARIDDQQVNKSIFSAVINNWLMQEPRKSSESNQSLNLVSDEKNNSFADSLQSMIFLKVLEKMNEVFKSNLLAEPADLLVIILQILDFARDSKEISVEPDSDDEDEDDAANLTNLMDNNDEDMIINDNTLEVALKLINSIIPTFHSAYSPKEKELLSSIQKKIEPFVSRDDCKELYDEISDVLLLPTSQDEPNSSNEHDKALLKKALTNVNDPLVPIRAHGLLQLRQLIEKKSPLIDVKKVFAIHITQLHDQDAFIYLNVIRGLGVLVQFAPNETLDLLLQFYRACRNKNSVDDILKVGEVFVHYVSAQGKSFSGPKAAKLIEVCLENIRAKDQVDNRIRMSSMSILGQCLESNALGIQGLIADILDCAFGILTFETGNDTDDINIKRNSAIMRRSAVHVVYDLMLNSGLNLFPENYPPEKIKSTLEYVATQDDDYLVCEQIKTVSNHLDALLQEKVIGGLAN